MQIQISIPEDELRKLLTDILPVMVSGQKLKSDLILTFDEKNISFDSKSKTIKGKVAEISLSDKDVKKLGL